MNKTRPSNGQKTAAGPANFSGRANPQYEQVKTALLLRPLIPARQAFDDEKFQELCESIREIGYIFSPLIVEREGKNFRIHAGDRRYHAAQQLGLETVPCMVYDAGTVTGEAVKSHENGIREELNCAEEAVYFRQLLEGPCENDVEKLAAMVKQKIGYVQQRLALILGDERVFQGLAAGLISIGVAQELNLVQDPDYRLQYLTVAAQGGCSVRQMRDWRTAANIMIQNREPGQLPPMVETQPPPPPPNSQPCCLFCGKDEDQHEMQVLFAHRSCQKAAERRALGQ